MVVLGQGEPGSSRVCNRGCVCMSVDLGETRCRTEAGGEVRGGEEIPTSSLILKLVLLSKVYLKDKERMRKIPSSVHSKNVCNIWAQA